MKLSSKMSQIHNLKKYTTKESTIRLYIIPFYFKYTRTVAKIAPLVIGDNFNSHVHSFKYRRK